MDNRKSIPLTFDKGVYSAGDTAVIPDGYVQSMVNYLPRPNRYPARPPFVYDSIMSVNGLGNWDDPTNKATRLVGVNTAGAMFIKSATLNTETWGSTVGTVTGTRLTDYANLRGKFFAMFDNGAGLPSGAASYDGMNFDATPFNSVIAARTVTTLNERLFLAYPRVAVTSLAPITVRSVGSTGWGAQATAPVVTITSGSTTLRRLGFQSASIVSSSTAISLTATTAELKYVTRFDMRAVSAIAEMPLTLRTVVQTPAWASTTYAVGDVIRDTTYLYRAIVGGLAGGGAPAFPTAYGDTVVDNAVTWQNIGTQVVGSLDIDIPTLQANPNWATYSYTSLIPQHSNTIGILFSIETGNTNTPTPAAYVPVDVSYVDGLTDGDPAKACRGMQFTLGDFYFPFVNTESSDSATIDMTEIVWSEIADGKEIKAANTYKLREAPGDPTAACAIGGRLLVFKRSAFWQFQGTSDPDIPIRKERVNAVVGCLGSRALDTMEDEVFFIGENEIYRYRVGQESPTPMCGDGMREEIMNKAAATWVEAQATYKRPLLTIDKSRLIMWVYTQKNKLYSYDLRQKLWCSHEIGPGIPVEAMAWNQNTDNLYAAWGGYGLSRLDDAAGANDTIDNTANTYGVTKTLILRPVELYVPPRYEYAMQSVRFFHGATASQSGQTVTVSYSFDQGSTYPKSQVATVAPLSAGGDFVPLRIPCRQGRASVTIKIEHVGKAGETEWVLSPRAYADVIVRREERELSNPTMGSATL